MNEKEIIYDWNQFVQSPGPHHDFTLNDETLRDGLQSPSVTDPKIETKLKVLHLIASLGIQSADLGLPGAGLHVVKTVEALAREIVKSKLPIFPNCAARTVVGDIEPIVEISQRTGLEIEVMAFIGSSPIRIYTEDWDQPMMLKRVTDSISFAVKNGLPACLVTEDTVRSRPEMIQALYTAALDAGATRICLCDTVGHATPDGTQALVRFARKKIVKAGGYEGVHIDWHGHNDRGHAVPNALSALEAGADRVHGTAVGIGERCGNTSMDQLLINLYLLGWYRHDLSKLMEYCETVSNAVGEPIPDNYPVVGRDAFRTATGVHAAAVIKAQKKGDAWLADRIYSGVPASVVGRKQEIEIGPVSGESNVVYWLQNHGIEPTVKRVKAVFTKAKQSNHVLSKKQVLNALNGQKTRATRKS
jgi:2-isopropylmalate synthase